MKNLFHKLPIPISGLALALAGAGNFLASYGEGIKWFFGLVSCLILLLLTIKILAQINWFKEEMKNPLSASVFCTYPMTVMILSTYLKPFLGGISPLLWYAAVVMHWTLILYFTKQFVFQFNIKQVFPSWFIVYVGIAAASMTAKPFQATSIGQLFFWFALIALIMLMGIVSKRVFSVGEIPKPALPTLVIYAAPTSLCLAGYINAFDQKNLPLLIILLLGSQLIYFTALAKMISLIKPPFLPSFSAFTFPVVISGTALKLSVGALTSAGYSLSFLKYLVQFEEAVALIVVLYVLIQYVLFLLSAPKPVASSGK